MSRPSRRIAPALGRRIPAMASTSSRLAVAVDARDADDLARPDVEREPAHGVEAAVVQARAGPAPAAPARPGAAGALSTISSTSRPTMSSARLRSVAPATGTVATFLPRRSTVTRSATASTSSSLWVMTMMAVPAASQLAQHAEQLLRLLRRQHRGRLVEDQHLRVAVERLQDLDALLLADRTGSRPGPAGRRRGRSARDSSRTRSSAAAMSRRRPCAARRRARCSRPPSSPGSA